MKKGVGLFRMIAMLAASPAFGQSTDRTIFVWQVSDTSVKIEDVSNSEVTITAGGHLSFHRRGLISIVIRLPNDALNIRCEYPSEPLDSGQTYSTASDHIALVRVAQSIVRETLEFDLRDLAIFENSVLDFAKVDDATCVYRVNGSTREFQ